MDKRLKTIGKQIKQLSGEWELEEEAPIVIRYFPPGEEPGYKPPAPHYIVNHKTGERMKITDREYEKRLKDEDVNIKIKFVTEAEIEEEEAKHETSF